MELDETVEAKVNERGESRRVVKSYGFDSSGEISTGFHLTVKITYDLLDVLGHVPKVDILHSWVPVAILGPIKKGPLDPYDNPSQEVNSH